MSERLFRRWLPVPAMARPRRPLSIRASHASWSIRFSLRMMISGAPSSSSRLRRLLRLMTRRYRSLRSEVAKRPPSSWTMGPQVRRDDRQDRQDHPLGARAGAAERLDEAQALDGLLAAHAGGGADLAVEARAEPLEVHALDQLTDGLGAHAGAEQAGGAADAGAVLAVELAEVPAVERGLGKQHAGLELRDLVLGAALRISSLRPSASPVSRSRSASSGRPSGGAGRRPAGATPASSAASRSWMLGVDALDLVRWRPS